MSVGEQAPAQAPEQPPAEAPGAASIAGDALFGSDHITHFERSPADVLRLAVFAVVTVVVLALVLWAEDTLTGVEAAVVERLGFLTPSAERLLNSATLVIVALAGATTVATLIWTRRVRVLGYLASAVVGAGGAMTAVHRWLDGRSTAAIVNSTARRAALGTVPDVASLAALVAALVVLGPFVTRRWRRAGAITLAIAVLAHIVLSANVSGQVFLALALGATIGCGVLLAFGRPNTHPSLTAVADAMRRVGLPLSSLRPASVDARGSTPYFATLAEGGEVFAKVLGADERAADLLFRTYRSIRYKNLGDERPFSSLRRTVEHEALVSMQARDVGIRTPRLRGIADVGSDSMLLAYDMLDGRSLDQVADDDLDDVLLNGIWAQVALLRKHRIAHRDLRRANLFVDADHQPWIIDFGFSEVAASDALLAADISQLLVALAVKVGVDRTVTSAVTTLGAPAVASGLPRLQPSALSGATRDALKQHPGLLQQLQESVAELAHVDAPEFEQLQRISGKSILTVAMIAAITYFLVPQLADVPGILHQVRGANWWLSPLILGVSAATYVGATLSMLGSVPERIAGGPTFLAQVASSFAGRLAPSSLGGMALNVRFLEKQGVDAPVAVSGVGLNSLGGLVMHLTLTVLFIVWAGKNAFGSIRLPNPRSLLLGAAAVLVVAAIAFAVPSVRRLVFGKLLPILRRSVGGVAAVLHRPGKVALLLGGSAMVTFSYIVGVYLSIRAFGGELDLARVGTVYLLAAAVSMAAPTPGGLGALEAALIAGLVASGLSNTVAVPAVFLYRLATYWIPIVPGWFSFTWLRRQEYI